jgi:hypothetical protein
VRPPDGGTLGLEWKQGVATTAESYSLKRGPAKPPISTHPAFPAITALWFAGLLGFGSLVLPIALLERLVAVTGIAALVPAAAPPLGFTAHAAIALAAAIVGAALGLLLAHRIALAHAAEPMPRSFADEDEDQPLQPLLVSEELDEQGLATATPLRHKRRSLAIAEDGDRGAGPEAALPIDDTLAAPVEAAAAEPVAEEPLELSAFGEPGEVEDLMPEIEPGEPFRQDQPMTDHTDDHGDDTEGPTTESLAPSRSAATRDPLPFAPPSLRRLDATAFDDEPGEGGVPDAERPLDELGLVQLAERLGAALQKRRELAAQKPATPAPAPVAADDAFDAAAPEEAARAMADFFAPGRAAESADSEPGDTPPPLPRFALGGYDEDDDDEALAPPFPLSFETPPAAPSADEDEPDEQVDETDGNEDEYSSLLEMTHPFGRPFDPPGEPEDYGASAGSHDAGDAERSLRDALATLQRLSGAA